MDGDSSIHMVIICENRFWPIPIWWYIATSSTRTRRGGSCLRDIYIRPFSSIELACAVRQPSPCVHSAKVVSCFTCHIWSSTSHFALHTSHCTLHTQANRPHTGGTFHRRLQPLYTEKHKVSCPGFLPTTQSMQHSCSHSNAICNRSFKQRIELRTTCCRTQRRNQTTAAAPAAHRRCFSSPAADNSTRTIYFTTNTTTFFITTISSNERLHRSRSTTTSFTVSQGILPTQQQGTLPTAEAVASTLPHSRSSRSTHDRWRTSNTNHKSDSLSQCAPCMLIQAT